MRSVVLTSASRIFCGGFDLNTLAKADAETFGRFFVYLLIVLERMRLGVADLGRYLDPDMPMAIRRES